MLRIVLRTIVVFALLASTACSSVDDDPASLSSWETVDTQGTPTARHEAALVAFDEKLYLIGGRRINPVDVFDPATRTWEARSHSPIELHHFQPVVIDDAIYLMGAMTGGWPHETPLDRVVIYYPATDTFEFGDTIPEERRRGGAGAVLHNGKIYLVGGIDNGHMDGYRPWLDEYDPKTGEWRVLPDAPHARDHFQAVVVDNKLYAFAGRRSEYKTRKSFELTTTYGDVFHFDTGRWEPVSERTAIPTERAGNMAYAWDGYVIVGGGESASQVTAHQEVEAFDTTSGTWQVWPSLNRGRHGSGFAVIGDYLYTASGCGNRGGEPELTSVERLRLESRERSNAPEPIAARPVYAQWHTVTLSLEGPDTSEMAEENPFTDYLLQVEFRHDESRYMVRGFYAADGDAANTGAERGNVWQARFLPDKVGEWTYKASLSPGPGVAAAEGHAAAAQPVPIATSAGSFIVEPSDKASPDFRAPGRGSLGTANGYFQFRESRDYWIKGGTNSPENLLAYAGFDGTYRIEEAAREGEASAGNTLHNYGAHLDDWREGDPTWADGRGRSLVGATNYLSSTGMNAAYFLTLNILGDGRDVWPYRDPEDFTRFDVSKLEQWEVLFQHMQSKGILLHLVLQETENELMLDDGDTGPLRSLYFNELIARFGHHPALVWNLGEENGPVHWRPEGQNDDQREAMARFLMSSDPYRHPVLLHTHSEPGDKDTILQPLLGLEAIDGLSFQVSDRNTVNHEVRKWRRLARDSGHDWLITMDEIGEWHTGALPDELDPQHDTLRRHALWGSLLGGAAGVEWYFGARYPHNDLTSENWRLRESLWTQTRHALAFFEQHIPYWQMTPCKATIVAEDAYCLAEATRVYALYVPAGASLEFQPEDPEIAYTVSWYDPLLGGELQIGDVGIVRGGGAQALRPPPGADARDWVALIRADKEMSLRSAPPSPAPAS